MGKNSYDFEAPQKLRKMLTSSSYILLHGAQDKKFDVLNFMTFRMANSSIIQFSPTYHLESVSEKKYTYMVLASLASFATIDNKYEGNIALRLHYTLK